jgi:hypothetical protein
MKKLYFVARYNPDLKQTEKVGIYVNFETAVQAMVAASMGGVWVAITEEVIADGEGELR